METEDALREKKKEEAAAPDAMPPPVPAPVPVPPEAHPITVAEVAASPAPPADVSNISMPRPLGLTRRSEELFAEAQKKANEALRAAGARPKVDKYFGSKLPPVCRQLGCYVTDDGKFFYCINPHCHKDKKRETKFNRRKKSVVYFYCPKCRSREIQLHLKTNQYECLDCAYNWKH